MPDELRVGRRRPALPKKAQPEVPARPERRRGPARGSKPGVDLGAKGERPATRPPAADFSSEVAEALSAGGDGPILALSEEALRAASQVQKVAMLRTLMSHGEGKLGRLASKLVEVGGGTRNLDPFPVFESRQAAILRILRTAEDGASLDYLLTRVNKGRLLRALDGAEDREARLLIERLSAVSPGDWEGFQRYLDVVTASRSAGPNQLKLLIDEEFLPELTREIDQARRSINLMMFEVESDEVGFEVARKLAEKARQGVKVRVLLDQYGTVHQHARGEELIALLRAGGVEVVVNPSHRLLAAHLDHRKLWVFDEQVAFCGGMNVGLRYLDEWHDQQTRVEGPAVRELEQLFRSHFRLREAECFAPAQSTPLPPAPGADTRVLNHQGNGQDRNIKAFYLRAIATAESSIQIANLYFADREVAEALCRAARRGVKVQLVLPHQSDPWILGEVAKYYYPALLEAGVELYEYGSRLAHHKVAVFDGQVATVGSSNLDARSLEFNDELNLVVTDQSFAGELQRRMFEPDIRSSARVTEHRPSLIGRVRQYLFQKAGAWL